MANGSDDRPLGRREIQFWFGIIAVIASIVVAWASLDARCTTNRTDLTRLETSFEAHLKDTKLANDIADIQMRMVRIETQLLYLRTAVDSQTPSGEVP